jgi:hypothetical protein
MRDFIIKILIFSAICGAVIFAVFALANGKSDAYYLKFTTPKQHSFILGTSKAAQGLQPEIFNEIIYPEKKLYFYNYSFSLDDSPYGPVYLESIEKKLDPSTKNGIFVLTVDPWSFSSLKSKSPDSLRFYEIDGILGGLGCVAMNPNIFYFINSYQYSYFQIILNLKTQKREFLKTDGWLEIRVPMDSISINERTKNKVQFYEENLISRSEFSNARFDYLIKTIAFLQQHGTVFLVRLPVTEKIFRVEDQFMPDFDKKMGQLSEMYNIPYMNYRKLPHVYDYTDGNHLYKTSGAVVSAEIANWILEEQAKKKK